MDYKMILEQLSRLLIASFCGILVGWERKSRMKEAGIRTHFIVALGAALMMIISKYLFNIHRLRDLMISKFKTV
jgi:putative Mg2+ transporter-C (MgtC) family protein